MKSLGNITVTEIRDISTVFSPRGRQFEMIKRPAMGISFCKDGKITYSHKGRKFVSDKNCAVILPMGADYRLYGDETGNFPLINFFCTDYSPDTFTVIPLASPESFLRDFERMYSLSLFEGNHAAIMSIFYDIINRLAGEGKGDYDVLSPAAEYIENNYADPALSNTLLANLCGISEVYFRRLFTKSRGQSPKQYVLNIRIRRAKQLLSDSGISVGEVSELCGFSSLYHFCRAFKEKTGMTPTEYAKFSAKSGI